VPGATSPGVKHLDTEADQSSLFNAELKIRGAMPPFPLHASVACIGTNCTVLLLLKENYWTPPIPIPGCVPMDNSK
jgi:hypothetical protein